MTALLTRLPPLSPCCDVPLSGGPVIFWCPSCGKDVHGSVIDHEARSGARDGAG
jgi:hypothetical protein